LGVPTDSPAASPTAHLPRNTLILLVSNLGGAALSFLLSALIGRALGTEGLGAYAVALAWVFPLSLVVEFGLSTLMTRDLAGNLSSAHAYLETVTRLRLLIGGTVMFLLILAAPLISSDPLVITGLQVSAPLVIILPFFSSFSAIYKAHGDMRPVAYLNIGMLMVQVILTAAVLLNGADVIAALKLNTLTSAGQLLAAWYIYRTRFYTPSHEPTPSASAEAPKRFIFLPLSTQWRGGRGVRSAFRGESLRLLRLAFPFALAALFAALQTRFSVILLEHLASTAEVGYFSAASRFAEAARMIPNAYFGALFPALSALAAAPLVMRQTFRRALWGLTAFGIAAGIGFSVLALPLLTLTYGDAFAPAAPVLALLGWSLLFSLLRGGRTLYLYALGHEGRVNGVNAVVIGLQAVFSLLLIPPLGALGVAGVHVIIEIAGLALLWLWRIGDRTLAGGSTSG
jgi:O-antigen/teichoic acid export membrane protein